jgi:hypothetical protein
MLPSTVSKGVRSAVPRQKAEVAPRGPQTVPCSAWIVWLVLNTYLYFRSTAPDRSLLPIGENIRLGKEAIAWKSPDGAVELVMPASRSAETARVLCAHNAFRGELVHLHAGFHLSLHPLRQTPLVQITRSPRASSAVQVKMATRKTRLTRNTFVRPFPLRPHA